MKFSILAIPLLVSCAAAEIGDLCSYNGNWGTCESTSWCGSNDGNDDIFNLCPDDPYYVRCCFEPLCYDRMGYCDVTSNIGGCEASGGHFESGFCPGPDNYKCCVES
ncbi:hypothetical protein L207DRAFT_445366 [Hyaloscypha variabilis F]|uniref:Uncharacterized protein n=1 Tax=Hyaloscypha variabilis (strain UAMH 11265 / GT02V1 / F) TaxID=1149755 RepID=A0A2J6QT76_HYAVF|nr:hypothetical protein L207DRAFT_445366 [Hyaloscypha variabilis F]